MFCKFCGKELQDGMKFCTGCGNPVTVKAPEPQQVEDPVEETPVPEVAPLTEETTSLPQEQPETQTPIWEADPGDGTVYHVPANDIPPLLDEPMEEPIFEEPAPKKKKNLPMILLSAGLALMVLAAGFFLWRWLTTAGEADDLRKDKSSLERKVTKLEDELDNANRDLTEANEEYDEINSAYIDLQNQYNLLYGNYDEMVQNAAASATEFAQIQEVYDFFMEYAVICCEDSEYYHTYYCKDINWSAFWIFNIDYAVSEGREPCPYCH